MEENMEEGEGRREENIKEREKEGRREGRWWGRYRRGKKEGRCWGIWWGGIYSERIPGILSPILLLGILFILLVECTMYVHSYCTIPIEICTALLLCTLCGSSVSIGYSAQYTVLYCTIGGKDLYG